MRTPAFCLVAMLAALASVVGAQGGMRADSARADSARADSARADSAAAQRLGDVRVTVTRRDAAVQRLPWAVGVQGKAELTRGQATLGIDEALNNIPGVYVANRYNYSLDQRLSIRGAGARANFGIRGVKVLLDGVPQSLPDGQNQLTNVDLADIARVEVLRGSASSLYGNGSGGVIAFTTDLTAPDALGQSVRVTSGAFGLTKLHTRVSGRSGAAVGSLSVSRTTLDGFRQYSAADVRQLVGALDYALGGATLLALRASATEMPTSLNPGALTAAEYAANRDSAAAINVARNASKAISQNQFSVKMRHAAPGGAEWAAVAYVVRRFVDNPLATTPPGPLVPNVGTYSTLNRWVTGLRLDGARSLGAGTGAPRASAGLDLQRSYDIRRNWRATRGHPSAPTDTLLLHQDESVIALGPFVAVQWVPRAPLTLSAGARWDRLTFDVTDHFTRDGLDNTGSRAMTAASGHVGASYVVSGAFTPYVNFSTAFETPTTTELNARPDGVGGFNPDLGPQRVRMLEAGARGALGDRVDFTLSVFRSEASDAIIQYLETNGRAYFRNAGRTRNDGVEVGVAARVASWLDLSVAWTAANYRFVEYRVPRGAVTDTLDGKKQAGVPDRYVRLGVRARWRGASLDADHTMSAAMFADDRNTLRVDDWGRGALNVRAAWSGALRGLRLEPFAAVSNALNQAYVGSVTLNGAFGRVLEPAPLRNYYVGMELGWRVVR